MVKALKTGISTKISLSHTEINDEATEYIAIRVKSWREKTTTSMSKQMKLLHI